MKMKKYRALRKFVGSFLCGTPIRFEKDDTIECDKLTAKYINAIQPLTFEIITPNLGYDLSTGTISTIPEKSFDEVMEEVLLDRAEAWEKLAE